MFSTSKHSKYWASRKINWEEHYLKTWNHPHRAYIVRVLKSFYWLSLIEVGVGGGANLVKIWKEFHEKLKIPIQIGGTDINEDAIALCEKTFRSGKHGEYPGGVFKVCSGEDLMMSDKSVDVYLSDMTLIYVGPVMIHKWVKEMKRITRGRVVLCEFHSSNWFARLRLRLQTGYNAYNYKKLLTQHGFYDVVVYPLPPDAYPDAQDFPRSIIVAVAPSKYVSS